MRFLGSLFIGLCFLIYALYCHQNGGSHHKGRGWVTKEEAPKTGVESTVDTSKKEGIKKEQKSESLSEKK